MIQTGYVFPLSYSQQRLWFLDQLKPGSPFYNVPLCLRLRGKLNPAALQNALNRLIARHEVLRTNFVTENGQPYQLVQPTRVIEMAVKDLSGLSETVRQHQAEQLQEQEALQPFDLASEALVRASLLKLESDLHLLLLTFHHIVTDGWSMGIFTSELGQFYQAECAGEILELPELPIQYADYALWQREWLQGANLEQELAYWREHMAGAPQVLELPTDFPRPAVQSNRGAHYKIELDLELAHKLREFNRESGATTFMTLLAAFKLLLSRYSGQEDIVIGTPIANRTQPEVAGLIGFFSNTVVMRTDLSGNPTFRQLVQRVTKSALGAYAHQTLPFDTLVDELRPQRDLSHAPLFQYQFTLQKAPSDDLTLADLEVEMLDTESASSKWDLTLMLSEGNNGELFGFIEYSTDLFEEATIARLASCWKTLLASVVEKPDLPIGQIKLLDDDHRRQLQAWSSAAQTYPAEICLHQIVEQQAHRQPTAPALTFQGQILSYAELNARANQLAHYLKDLGVGPEVTVGICSERGFDMVVGMLAVLKAGGAYVPLDPAYPQERLAYMLENSSVPVLLTQEALLDNLPSSWAQTFCLDSDWAMVASYPTENPVSGVAPDNLAYIIYTSGSTGQPKGVLVRHRGVAQVINSAVKALQLKPTDKVLQLASFSFDASVWEIFTTFQAGACLCLNPQADLMPGEAFVRLLQTQAISFATLPPSLLTALTPWAAELTTLQTIVSAGEACSPETVAKWAKNRRFINAYGPTEASICASMSVPLKAGQAITIGQPVEHAELYVLDKKLQQSPIGVPGELYIGGANLARGYLGRPELTAERFIPNPFSAESGARLYKTGDLVRYLNNGQLEFLGRIDNQVKLRGYRIELGEIEEALLQHPQVRSAAAIVRQDQPGEKRLVAYIVTAENQPLETAHLREFLQKRLPTYMLPATFVRLDALPLTPNGKVDRKALPAPEQQGRAGSDFAAPQTELEILLAQLWQTVLGVATIGRDDNYFALGGDSIRVVQICYEASKHNLALTPQDLFQYPTIAKLAQYLGDEPTANRVRNIPLELAALPEALLQNLPADTEDAYPASKMQILMLKNYASIPGAYHGLQSFRVSDPTCSLEAFKEALVLQTKKHPALRTVFYYPAVGEPVQVVRCYLPPTIVEMDLSYFAAAEQENFIEEIIRQERNNLFDPTDLNQPLVRYHLFSLADDTFQIMMTTHHAIEDGWGFAYFLGELFEYYQQLKAGARPTSEVAVNSYKEFIALEQEIIRDGAAQAFWQEFLAGHMPVTLPHRTNVSESQQNDTEPNLLDEGLSQRLQAMATTLHISPKAIYLTAFLEALSRVMGGFAPAVGVISNGRTERLTEPFKTLGLFWNILPFYCPDVAASPVEQVRLVQERLLQQEPFARYPLSEIAAGQGSQELFYAVFNFIHFHNLEQLPSEDELSLTATHAYDKFHYPMNFVVSVNPFSKAILFKAEYDNAYFSPETIEKLHQTFEQVLAEIDQSYAD